MQAGLVYLEAAEAALGAAAEGDTSVRVCVLGEDWGAGDTGRGASDRRMPGVSGRFRQPLDSQCSQWMLCKGRQAGGQEGVGGTRFSYL